MYPVRGKHNQDVRSLRDNTQLSLVGTSCTGIYIVPQQTTIYIPDTAFSTGTTGHRGVISRGGGGELPYETDGDARRLA